MTTVLLVGAVVAVIAVVVRTPRWPDRRSRPMTVALAAMALLALVRARGVAEWLDRTADRWTGLPDTALLIGDLLIITASWALCRHVAQAWGHEKLFPVINYTAVGAAVLLGATYAPSGTHGWWSMVQTHIAPVVVLLGHVAVLITASVALRAPATVDRWTLSLIVAGAICGTITGTLRLTTDFNGSFHGLRSTVGALTIALYAAAALVNYARQRRTSRV